MQDQSFKTVMKVIINYYQLIVLDSLLIYSAGGKVIVT